MWKPYYQLEHIDDYDGDGDPRYHNDFNELFLNFNHTATAAINAETKFTEMFLKSH